MKIGKRVLLFFGPQPLASAPAPCPLPPAQIAFSQPPCIKIYFFTAPDDQNYYFTALLVGNISCISVLSKFQTFHLKEDKICN